MEIVMRTGIFVAALLFGCTETEKETAATDTGQDTDDEQGSLDSADTAEDEDPVEELGDSPMITDVEGAFGYYQGIGDIIEIHIYYLDQQDDLFNATLYLSYSTSGESNSYTIPIDGAQALLEDGEVVVMFSDVSTSQTYDFTLQLEDLAGNLSNEETLQVSD
jgi:hypothetical protein